MSQDPLNIEDVVRTTHAGRSIARGRHGPIPDLTVFRTEWLYAPDPSKPRGWSQIVHASAPGVGSVRFTWGPGGGYLVAFGYTWNVEVRARAKRLPVANRR
jgi:hypothetical protein